MLQKHSDLIMSQLQPSDIVLDIGGWAHPFNRANYVLDQEPYETRGYYNRTFRKNNPLPPLGGNVEYFTAGTWIQRDICAHQPFPFGDKSLDYVICSHTLEDIRDPLWVCAEMIRIAKRGYVEVPSRIWETCRGFEPGIAGLSHHRWLIDIVGNDITFTMKFHSIHGHWRLSLPPKFAQHLEDSQAFTWLFWNDTFTFHEQTIHGTEQVNASLENFVRSVKPYPGWLLKADTTLRQASHFLKRVSRYALSR
jgi:Methionine biosynthesis protein MetW